MALLYNRAGVSCATTGTGTVTLGAAIPAATSPFSCSYQTFATSGVANGQVVSYLILDTNGAWEYGTGTYTAAGTTLTRTLGQSSTGALLNLSGTSQVFVTARKEDLLSVSETQTANTIFSGPSSGGAATPTFRTLVSADISGTTPTVQRFLSGSGTYTPAAGTKWIRARVAAGGGGGGAAATNAGSVGNDSSFGTWTTVHGNGGNAGSGATSQNGGAGGTGGTDGTGTLIARCPGTDGSTSDASQNLGGSGGDSAFFVGGGRGKTTATAAGQTAKANSGGGGAGAAVNGTGDGGGGGAGECVEFFMTAAQIGASLSYTVGAGGAGGTAGTQAGGAGAAGIIIIEEFYI